MIFRFPLCVVLILLAGTVQAALPPLVCPAGGPIGTVDLRVVPARGGEPLPLRTINRLEEADTIIYKPLLRSGEERKGEVAMVLVPADKKAAGESLLILDPKDAKAEQQWKVPWRTAVVAFVYGPSGLSARKVRGFLERDEELVSQLADYAEKTAQTEALIAALSSPTSSAAVVQSALQGFSSQYGLNVQLDRTAPPNQQAMTLFRALNPAIATYDPISTAGPQQVGQAASLATSVATLFFGSPVGLAAGGTAMLLNLRSMAFPKAEFRSSFAQTMPGDGLGLCGRRDPAPPHTKVAYLWASRVPNIGPPQITIGRANSLPTGVKSPVPVTMPENDWKYADRARNWALKGEGGKELPIAVHKLADTKSVEVDLAGVKPGTYDLLASWDWDRFVVKGQIVARPPSDFAKARLTPASQDELVARAGKVPVTVANADFEFVTKVEIEKLNDRFASPAAVPFILPHGLRMGPQERMEIQVNTVDLDPGDYSLLITQTDGKARAVPVKILAAPPQIQNLPVVLNQGSQGVEYTLRGERLNLLNRIEVPKADAKLGPAKGSAERRLSIRLEPDVAAGTTLAAKAYIQDRTEPMTLADAVRVVGPRPQITEARVSQPPNQDVQLVSGELPGGMYLSAILRVTGLQTNSGIRLGCSEPGTPVRSLRMGERAGAWSLQQLGPDQAFVSFDTGMWPNGCALGAVVSNGPEGDSDRYDLGRIVRVPHIEKFEVPPAPEGATAEASADVAATLTGQNLETIEKVGWAADQPVAVTALPLPIPGDATRQVLQLTLPRPPETRPVLFVWLRGETQPRLTNVRP